MDLESFRVMVERQRAYAEGKSPIYVELLRVLGEALAGDCTWFSRLSSAWKDRQFGPYYEAPSLLLAGLHREALAGRAPELTRSLASCGGGCAAAAAAEAALRWLEGAPSSFFDSLASERLQTNEPGRAVGWLLPAAVAFLPRAMPFHLVDLGTSAGLTLIGDYLPRDASLLAEDGSLAGEPGHWRAAPFPVLTRTGLDARPRRLADAQDRLWLKACLWPDDLARHARFDRAAELFLRLELDRTGPRLAETPFSGMPTWIGERFQPHSEEGLLVYNSQAADFLGQDEYRAMSDGLARVLEPWGERAYWVELELPRGGGEVHELRVHRWMRGRFESRVLATMAAHPRGLLLCSGWDFLKPSAPTHLPRFTREEPPRAMAPGVYRFVTRPPAGDEG